MNRRFAIGSLIAAGAGTLGAVGWNLWRGPRGPMQAKINPPLPAPDRVGAVFHLGHSLVGEDMPSMFAQLGGHGYTAQIGWGTTLKQHWQDEERIGGYQLRAEGMPPTPAKAALAAGGFDAVVLTEMVEIRDAIRWYDSPRFLADWVRLARQTNPQLPVYLYETWHNLDDPAGWLERIDADLDAHWLSEVVAPAETRRGVGPIHLIPGGQALAAVVRAAEAGQIPGLTRREQLFRLDDKGQIDTIHIGDLGAYVVALAHYAVIYQQSPVGLPHRLTRADGSAALALDDTAAPNVQRIVRDVVAATPHAGVSSGRLS